MLSIIKLIFKFCFGVVLLIFTNMFFATFGMSIAINWLSIAIVGCLGVPGLISFVTISLL